MLMSMIPSTIIPGRHGTSINQQDEESVLTQMTYNTAVGFVLLLEQGRWTFLLNTVYLKSEFIYKQFKFRKFRS